MNTDTPRQKADYRRVSLVRQEHPDGCAVAATAMVLGMTYADTYDLMSQQWGEDDLLKSGGVSHFVTDRALIAHGFAMQRRYRVWQPEDWPPAPFAPIHMASVHTSRGHFVVMRADGTVLDPASGESPSLDGYDVQNVVGLWRIGSSTVRRCRMTGAVQSVGDDHE